MSEVEPDLRKLESAGKIRRWSLERVQFLLAHLESFVDDELRDLRERARVFTPAGGLETVENLVSTDPNDPRLPQTVLEKLAAFFDAGVLLQRGMAHEDSNWWVTDLFWRGNCFHLELADQVRANSLVPEITPLQVHRASATRVLSEVKMKFLSPSPEASAYLMRPTPSLSYVLLSDLAPPFAVDHVANAHKLVNKCFLY